VLVCSRSRKEFVAKLGVAQEEADEALFWLEQLVGSEEVSAEVVEPLVKEGSELTAILTSSYTTARSRLRTAEGESKSRPDRTPQAPQIPSRSP
jgi:hypothetical protein